MVQPVHRGTKIKNGPTSQGTSQGTGYTITGVIFLAAAFLCLFYAYSVIKVFFDLRNEVETNPGVEGLDGLMGFLGAIFALSSVGVESLIMGILIGIVGIVLLILGVTFWSIGLKRNYN